MNSTSVIFNDENQTNTESLKVAACYGTTTKLHNFLPRNRCGTNSYEQNLYKKLSYIYAQVSWGSTLFMSMDQTMRRAARGHAQEVRNLKFILQLIPRYIAPDRRSSILSILRYPSISLRLVYPRRARNSR